MAVQGPFTVEEYEESFMLKASEFIKGAITEADAIYVFLFSTDSTSGDLWGFVVAI